MKKQEYRLRRESRRICTETYIIEVHKWYGWVKVWERTANLWEQEEMTCPEEFIPEKERTESNLRRCGVGYTELHANEVLARLREEL